MGTVFFEESDAKLYWCDQGLRAKLMSQSVKITDLQRVWCGKQSKILNSHAVLRANSECCLTLMSRDAELNLELLTKVELNILLAALKVLIERFCKGVKLTADTTARFPQLRETRRFS